MRNKLSSKNKAIAKVQKSKLHFAKNDFTSGELYSFINKVGLKSLLSPSFFNSISCERRMEIETLLPKCDKALIQDSFMNENLDILNNVYFNCACKYWMKKLKEGDFTNFLKELSHIRACKTKNSQQNHLKIGKKYALNGGIVNGHQLHVDSIHKPLISEETDDDDDEDKRYTIKDGPLHTDELKSFFHSKEEMIAYVQRHGLRGMLLDHGCYCRPFQPQIFIQDNLDVLFLSQEKVSDSSGTSSTSSQLNQKENKNCESSDKYANSSPNNKNVKNPHFLRVILHKGGDRSLPISPQTSSDSTDSVTSSGIVDQNEDNLTDELLTFTQKLLTSKTKMPCLIPISMTIPKTPTLAPHNY